MSSRGRALLSSLSSVAFLSISLAGAPAGAADPPDEGPGGGVGLELSGGFGDGGPQGGVLVGIAVRNFLFGLSIDALSSTTGSYTDAAGTTETTIARHRVGLGVRAPLLIRDNGRVVLFAAGDFGLSNQNAPGVASNGSPTSYHADGISWAIGPGLRYWATAHLAIGYLTRLRFTNLSGSAGALGSVGAVFSPDQHISSDSYEIEGVVQILAVF